MEFQSEKAYILEHFQEYRIIQSKVVFIHGLPSSLAQQKVLQRQLSYLGNTFRINTQYLSKDFYSAFIEFENELSAALLIVMLNEISICHRDLRVFYGSTKFCPHFLKNHQCNLTNCNYAHYYVPHLTHLRDQAKQIDHNGIALLPIYQQIPQSILIIASILQIQEHQTYLLNFGRERLQTLDLQLKTVISQQKAQMVQIESKTEEKKSDWEKLESEIESESVSNEGEKKEKEDPSRVQQFLDAAQRFLTKLIFESSVFVY